MDHEAFVFPDGKTFIVWSVEFENMKQEQQTSPCSYFDESTRKMRKGTIQFTLETGNVRFYSPCNNLLVGNQGMLTSPGDIFYEIVVSSIEALKDHDLVHGVASRKFAYETED